MYDRGLLVQMVTVITANIYDHATWIVIDETYGNGGLEVFSSMPYFCLVRSLYAYLSFFMS